MFVVKVLIAYGEGEESEQWRSKRASGGLKH